MNKPYEDHILESLYINGFGNKLTAIREYLSLINEKIALYQAERKYKEDENIIEYYTNIHRDYIRKIISSYKFLEEGYNYIEKNFNLVKLSAKKSEDPSAYNTIFITRNHLPKLKRNLIDFINNLREEYYLPDETTIEYGNKAIERVDKIKNANLKHGTNFGMRIENVLNRHPSP